LSGGGWAKPKNGEAHFGAWVGVRCERSEHGKSQLSIKYLCIILNTFLLFLIFFSVTTAVSDCALSRLQNALRSPPLAVNVVAACRRRGFHYCSDES